MNRKIKKRNKRAREKRKMLNKRRAHRPKQRGLLEMPHLMISGQYPKLESLMALAKGKEDATSTS